MLLLVFSIHVDTTAMLFTFVPSANVSATIRPLKGTFSLFHIINVFTNILASVWPSEGAVALHLIVAPFSGEDSAISPLINSCTVDVVIVKITSVGAVVSPGELALAVLLSLQVLSFV